MNDHVYLDNAAASPLRPEAVETLQTGAAAWANPSSLHTQGRRAKDMLEASRARLAKRLDVRPIEITFTANATESNNLVSSGVGGQICVPRGEHPSLGSVDADRLTEIKLLPSGQIDLGDLELKLQRGVSLVAMSLINSSTGVIQSVADIHKIINRQKEDRRPLLHIDASQACGVLNVRPHSLQADTVTISASKCGGPKGAAALYVNKDVALAKSMVGGPQEHGLRPGTENVSAIDSFVAAFEAAEDSRVNEHERLSELQSHLETELKQRGVVVVGEDSVRSPAISVIVAPGLSNEELLYKLDAAGIAVGIGSACHASSAEPNRSLSAMGLSKKDAHSSIRISLGWQNTKADIDRFVAVFRGIYDSPS